MRTASEKLIAPRRAGPANRPRLPALGRWWRHAAIVRHGAEVGVWVAFYIAIRAVVG